jgi:hypothetical protein
MTETGTYLASVITRMPSTTRSVYFSDDPQAPCITPVDGCFETVDGILSW